MNLALLTTILNLIPAIIIAIKAIEEAIPGEGKGEQKLAAIRSILEIIDSKTVDIWPKIQGVVTILVGIFNTTIWKK